VWRLATGVGLRGVKMGKALRWPKRGRAGHRPARPPTGPFQQDVPAVCDGRIGAIVTALIGEIDRPGRRKQARVSAT